MSNTTKKQPMSVVKKMMIALVGGLLVGIAFLLLREQLISSGNEGAWTILNKILFQDITAEDGVSAIGLFYIIGQLFMRGLQLAIVPLVLVSLSLAMCSISSSTKLGRIAGRTLIGFFLFYVCGAFLAGIVAYAVKSAGFFNVTLPSEAVTDAATLDAFNPLATIVNAVPSNIASAFSSNNSILAVVVVAIIIGLCMNALGEKADPLKKVLESVNEVIQLYLTFLINKVGPIAIFCLISRTFAIYGTDLDPCAIDATYENMDNNGISRDQYEVMIGNIIDDKAVQDKVGYEKYDIVAANILADVLVPLTPVIIHQMKKGGIYITSGIIEDKEDVVVEAVKEAGLEVLEVNHQGEWVSVTARKN